MVNVLTMYMPLLRGLLKLVGVRPQAVEIEPGTVLRFWIPSDDQTTSNASKKPNKPAVVFVHGFALDGILTWQFQVLALARDYAVYVPDLLFFGESITDRTERKVVFQAECVAKGLKKLGVEKCTLVGMSYGGMVGFKMAEMYPDLVESMVVSCTAMVMTESISRACLKRIGFSSWPEYLMPDTVKGVKEMLRIATYKLPWLPDFVHRSILEVMFGNRKERLELLDELIVSDKDFTVPHFTQKIHLLWGRDDIIFNMEEACNLKDQLEGKATLQYIGNAGHLAQSERPFAYSKHLKNILASLHDGGRRKQQ
ncbi:epoxide hydrolase [Salix suchowensis]|nr:epoxide hydrolase [Salix suchowensis]